MGAGTGTGGTTTGVAAAIATGETAAMTGTGTGGAAAAGVMITGAQAPRHAPCRRRRRRWTMHPSSTRCAALHVCATESHGNHAWGMVASSL